MRKMLKRMNQKGVWAGVLICFFQSRDDVPPGDSRDLNLQYVALTRNTITRTSAHLGKADRKVR